MAVDSVKVFRHFACWRHGTKLAIFLLHLRTEFFEAHLLSPLNIWQLWFPESFKVFMESPYTIQYPTGLQHWGWPSQSGAVVAAACARRGSAFCCPSLLPHHKQKIRRVIVHKEKDPLKGSKGMYIFLKPIISWNLSYVRKISIPSHKRTLPSRSRKRVTSQIWVTKKLVPSPKYTREIAWFKWAWNGFPTKRPACFWFDFSKSVICTSDRYDTKHKILLNFRVNSRPNGTKRWFWQYISQIWVQSSREIWTRNLISTNQL